MENSEEESICFREKEREEEESALRYLLVLFPKSSSSCPEGGKCVCWKQRVPRAKSLDSRLLGFMGGPKNTYNEVLLLSNHLSSSCLPLLLCNAGMGLIPAKNASFLPFFLAAF